MAAFSIAGTSSRQRRANETQTATYRINPDLVNNYPERWALRASLPKELERGLHGDLDLDRLAVAGGGLESPLPHCF